MAQADRDIDWGLTTWEGSRRAQLRRALQLTVRERLEAAEGLAEVARRFQEMRAQGRFASVRGGPTSQARAAREPMGPYTPGSMGPGGAGAATRYVETRLGVLSYAQLAPHLARNVLALEKRIEDGEFQPAPLDDALLLRFQSLACGDLVPQMAGWRRENVVVGAHQPPEFFEVPALVREYGLDLQARLSHGGGSGEVLLKNLAFAEGRLLFIHPFADFNGRVTRVWLRDILRRLDLPPVRLAPADDAGKEEYLAALRAADEGDLQALMGVWRGRFEGVR